MKGFDLDQVARPDADPGDPALNQLARASRSPRSSRSGDAKRKRLKEGRGAPQEPEGALEDDPARKPGNASARSSATSAARGIGQAEGRLEVRRRSVHRARGDDVAPLLAPERLAPARTRAQGPVVGRDSARATRCRPCFPGTSREPTWFSTIEPRLGSTCLRVRGRARRTTGYGRARTVAPQVRRRASASWPALLKVGGAGGGCNRRRPSGTGPRCSRRRRAPRRPRRRPILVATAARLSAFRCHARSFRDERVAGLRVARVADGDEGSCRSRPVLGKAVVVAGVERQDASASLPLADVAELSGPGRGRHAHEARNKPTAASWGRALPQLPRTRPKAFRRPVTTPEGTERDKSR